MNGALVGVAAVHGVHHVGHFVARCPDGVLALFGQFSMEGAETGTDSQTSVILQDTAPVPISHAQGSYTTHVFMIW